MSNVIFDTPADPINMLPTDKSEPSHSEIQIIETLFKQRKNTFQKLLLGTQDVLLVGFLFLLFSLPQLEEIIVKLFPTTSTSTYIMLVVKTLVFMCMYFVCKNIYLVRKR
jgi:hypothetical protein